MANDFLNSNKIYLSYFKDNIHLVDLYVRWMSDYEALCNTGSGISVYNREIVIRMFQEWLRDVNSKKFFIYHKELGIPIGDLELNLASDLVKYPGKEAEFGILIGEPKFRNNGYGKEATILALKYGFNFLRLDSICLQVYQDNTRAISLYSSLGFIETKKENVIHPHTKERSQEITMKLDKGNFRDKL